MIKDTDDKKIIFNHNKKFNTNQYEIRNQINNREIQINDETILHACITDITFEDEKITINFLSKDDQEFTYEISKEAETGEIPEYLQINEEDVVLLALKIYTLEAYKVFMNDTTLPEANAINELQAQITDLQDTITDLQGTITEKETTISTLNEQLSNAIPEKQKIFPITINDADYSLEIIEMDNAMVYFKIYNGNTVFAPSDFGGQRGAHLWVDDDGNSLTITPYFDDVELTNEPICTGYSSHAGQLYTVYPTPNDLLTRNLTNPIKFGLEIKVTDSDNSILSEDTIEYSFEVNTDLITSTIRIKRQLPIYWYGGTNSHGWTLHADYSQASTHKPTVEENIYGDTAFLVFNSNDEVISTIPGINNTISLNDITGWSYIKLIDEYGESVIFNKP